MKAGSGGYFIDDSGNHQTRDSPLRSHLTSWFDYFVVVGMVARYKFTQNCQYLFAL